MPNWLDQNPSVYWWMVGLVIGGSLLFIVRRLFIGGPKDEQRTDWWWTLSIYGLLSVGRWPTWLINRQLNVDESQLITGARTLRFDPLFWRSVDGGTAGPLDFYALIPAGWMFGGDSYLSARLTAFLLIGLTLMFAHQTLALAFGQQIARVATFPAVCFEALTCHGDFLHYSTELVPIALIAIAFFLFARRFAGEGTWKSNIVAGLALGSVPLAKLQVAPIAAALGVVWIASEYMMRTPDRKEWLNAQAALISAAAAPFVTILFIVMATGMWAYVKTSYITQNLAYASDAAASLPTHILLFYFWENGDQKTSLLFQWISGGALWLLLFLPASRAANRVQTLIALASLLTLIASVGCIILPHRPFLHYLQLLLLPWTLVLGSSMGSIVRAIDDTRRRFRAVILGSMMACTVGTIFLVRANKPPPTPNNLVAPESRSPSRVVAEIRKYSKPDEALGMWGWMPRYYVESELRQATRRPFGEMAAGAISDGFRQKYLSDLKRVSPPVFVDATGPGNFWFFDRKSSFETTFPALQEYMEANYVLTGEIDGARLYVRRDRWLAASIPPQIR